jgi:glyoxylase-like metal-dependent hydrolase (beta-lactamase superfamily II)
LVLVRDARDTLLHGGDLVPTAAHLTPAWVMSYDVDPRTAIEEKSRWLSQALEQGWVLFFGHDPNLQAITLKQEDQRVVPVSVLL